MLRIPMAPTTYVVIVTASDSDGATTDAIQTITVTVTDRANDAPVIEFGGGHIRGLGRSHFRGWESNWMVGNGTNSYGS